jgi:GPI mannosyltransferase 3
MTRARLRAALGAVALSAVAVRVVAYLLEPALHPDEIFQYLEPAWRHLHGVGWRPWEYRLGVRSWVLPAYHGAWMVILSWMGVKGGAAAHGWLRLHWALMGLVLVWASWRGGCSITRGILGASPAGPKSTATLVPGWQGGLLAATLVALWPTLAYFAPHTLSELPSMFLVVWGYVWAAEAVEEEGERAVRRARCAGVALGAGACLRVANAPLLLVPVLLLLVRRRRGEALQLVLATLPAVAAFGIVDWFTWGQFLHSFLAYLDYNLLQGRAVEHGAVPRTWYLAQLRDRLGAGFALLVLPPLATPRATWPWLLGGGALLGYLSTQAHQEERFVLLMWPLLLVAAAGWAGAWIARGGGWRWVVCAGAATALLGRDLAGTIHMPAYDYSDRFGIYAGQAWVGRQADATGVLLDGWIGFSGGYLSTGVSIPTVTFASALLPNPVFNYAVLREGSRELPLTVAAGFHPIGSRKGFVVLRRVPQQPPPSGKLQPPSESPPPSEEPPPSGSPPSDPPTLQTPFRNTRPSQHGIAGAPSGKHPPPSQSRSVAVGT